MSYPLISLLLDANYLNCADPRIRICNCREQWHPCMVHWVARRPEYIMNVKRIISLQNTVAAVGFCTWF